MSTRARPYGRTRTRGHVGVPFPLWADGARYTVPRQVTLPDGTTGTVLWITWVDEEGHYVNRSNENAGRLGDHWLATIALPDGGTHARLDTLLPAGAP